MAHLQGGVINLLYVKNAPVTIDVFQLNMWEPQLNALRFCMRLVCPRDTGTNEHSKGKKRTLLLVVGLDDDSSDSFAFAQASYILKK